jgi:hypothetical protein
MRSSGTGEERWYRCRAVFWECSPSERGRAAGPRARRCIGLPVTREGRGAGGRFGHKESNKGLHVLRSRPGPRVCHGHGHAPVLCRWAVGSPEESSSPEHDTARRLRRRRRARAQAGYWSTILQLWKGNDSIKIIILGRTKGSRQNHVERYSAFLLILITDSKRVADRPHAQVGSGQQAVGRNPSIWPSQDWRRSSRACPSP